MLRAGIRFTHRTGRPPKRLDFREPAKSSWEATLGLVLPSADSAAWRFGSWNAYLARMGYGEHPDATSVRQVEEAAIAHVEDVYPDMELVRSEQSAWDGVIAGQRVEIKGATLGVRKDKKEAYYFSFKTHSRKLSKTVDRAIFVGLGHDRDAQGLMPLVRFEFPKSALGFLDGKSTVMVYAQSIFGSGTSLYRPYIRWRAPLRMAHLCDKLPPDLPTSTD